MYSNKFCKYLWVLYCDYNRDFYFYFISVGIWFFFFISVCYKRYIDRNIIILGNNIIYDYKFIVVLLMIVLLSIYDNSFNFFF